MPVECEEMGLSLLDYIVGYRDLVLVDAVQTGHAPPGFLHQVELGDLKILPVMTPHFLGIGEILTLGEKLDSDTPAPAHLRGGSRESLHLGHHHDPGHPGGPGTVAIPEGHVTVSTEFTPDGTKLGGGTLKLYVKGQPAGEGTLKRSAFRHGLEPFEVGRDSITPVDPLVQGQGEFAFTGKIASVKYELK